MAKVHTRGLTSFFTLFGFLIMSISGLVLYVVPAGRVAYWTDWALIGLDKDGWDNIHILSSILFVIAGGFHTYFNWKPLMNYFKDKARRGVKLRRELALSSILSLLIVIGGIMPFPPLSYLLDFNAWLKETWIVAADYEPPFGHAELLSLKSFAQKMDIDLSLAVAELNTRGLVSIDPELTLAELAEANKMSPMSFYLLIKPFEAKPTQEDLQAYTPESVEVEFGGTGIGNQPIGAVCDKLGLDPDLALGRLSEAGLSARLDSTVKAVAAEGGVAPLEVMKVMLVEGYSPMPDQSE